MLPFALDMGSLFISVFIPISVIIIGADIVSTEISNGTMKTLLLRPLGRITIILSKWLAFFIASIGVMIFSNVLTFITSSLFLGIGNWNDHIVIGSDQFTSVPLWQFILISYGLNFFIVLVLTSVILFISVLFQKSIALSINMSMAMIILGLIFSNLQSQITSLKYIFVLHLDLIAHLHNQFAIQDATLVFSVTILFITACLSLTTSFILFKKRDMLV
ncbi:ABC transporter permease [Evansella sp. AB-P1]|uniref:ABC transporter permease n=1 Tax=Evansella sp. AB-P1 TaxID=3037653 RepID=UPI00241DB1CC|nr:ABC transporter permease [Evansella sp. AB-P1]MDG5789339.1 ABC transporter permease [Evansella sp. AB-P1]